MSKRKYINTSDFSPSAPIPVVSPPVKVGTGQATFKTATAAANAAREARDEARAEREASSELQRQCAGYTVKCMHHANECEEFLQSILRLARRELVWKMAIIIAILADVILQTFVLLRT